jgi:hypothetical protein
LPAVLAALIAAAEPSHVPFFIAGGALAVWAVVLSWIGLTRPAFPFGENGQRAVMGFSFVLAAVAIAMAIVTSK